MSLSSGAAGRGGVHLAHGVVRDPHALDGQRALRIGWRTLKRVGAGSLVEDRPTRKLHSNLRERLSDFCESQTSALSAAGSGSVQVGVQVGFRERSGREAERTRPRGLSRTQWGAELTSLLMICRPVICPQRHRCHLEKNATQMAAISWQLTGADVAAAQVDPGAARAGRRQPPLAALEALLPDVAREGLLLEHRTPAVDIWGSRQAAPIQPG